MKKDFLKGIYFSLGILFILGIVGTVFAVGFHQANEVLPGQFANGNYSFNGSLGIGTSSPATTLQIAGSHPSSRPMISLKNTNPGTTYTGTIRWIDGDGNNGWEIANNQLIGTGNLEFNENTTNRMVIAPGGYVGIGTSTPSSKLVISDFQRTIPVYGALTILSKSTAIGDVSGISFSQNDVQNRARAGIFSVSELSNGYASALVFYTANRVDGSTLTNSDERVRITSGGDICGPDADLSNCASDVRLKTNINPYQYGLNEILKFNPVSYNWNKKAEELGFNPNESQVSFIAQDVEKIIPEWVTEREDGYKKVADGNIKYILVNAIKEQQKQIEGQQKQIENLKKEIENLKK